MQEVLKFFKENPVFYIATMEGDQPRVRPFGAVAELNGKLYITTNNKKPVYDQIQKNPKIEISGMSTKGEWVRLEAKAFTDSNREARLKMLEENPSLEKMYSADDGIMEVLYLEDATATFYSFAGEPKTIKF